MGDPGPVGLRPGGVLQPHQLDRFIQQQRDTGANYEARIKAEQRGERVGKFRQELEPQFDERNPPPDLDDGIPEFLDRR